MSESADGEAIIELDHVVKEFRKGRGSAVRAVDDVSLRINRGDIFGIIGYSGAGKSTLVRMINGLERATSGTVRVLGSDITTLSESKLRPVRQKIGMIFQQFNLFSTKTVAENIAYPLQLDHWRKDYQQRRVQELLDFVGLAAYADSYPSQLSGGQKQRVGIARALATNPDILLADEATSALDPDTTIEVLALLKRVNEQLGITIVLITHQMNVVQQIANRVAVMSAGTVVEGGDVYDVFAAPQQSVTRRFIATALPGVPDEARIGAMREQWPGRLVTVLIRQKEVQAQQGVISASGQDISDLIAKHEVNSSLLFGGIDTVNGVAIGAITYEFTGEEDLVQAFLNDLARNSDIADFGTAQDPVPYAQAIVPVSNNTYGDKQLSDVDEGALTEAAEQQCECQAEK
ncbi:methionine ABC transporter ATP-binding protein [Bifidobacterium tsurumiense]|uniref:ABC transporter n=1 Tax=Bifidobacterium tsurumiense TaxID=356829 RepID=A0A087EIB3_9BIFI|nr:methionine ABC transporter ATP-binding protein [Bifidobacterium tsurumiense]KFJ07514.1 ABC transporter [Bifidobacterium tsurumiense]MDY4678061.1 methionine ABC transporter ATP-binding protein [Bifidobacterium tsurumiense]MSS12112.1 methionine ABC transporter ATP-binding protein [Bifidobacterium tsurumiense]